MLPAIVYENADIIVADKPAGLPVHGTGENDKRDTLISFLVSHYPLLKDVGENSIRPGIVHRLDKETSGLMVVAKNNETFYELKKMFQERKIEKKYMALVSGTMERDEGIIQSPLEKMGTKTVISRANSSNAAKIKQAITQYKVLKRFKEYTLVEVSPKTGRMHQIRGHFASINHPIACDKLYGGKAKKCPAGLGRHFLHAYYLRFQLKNALMEFEIDLPKDLKMALESLTI